MSNSLRQAILDGFKKAGWLSPSEDVVRQIEYAVNQMDGRAGNEGEKEERRQALIKEFFVAIPMLIDNPEALRDWLTTKIAEAQG
jgi:hypothetical protein